MAKFSHSELGALEKQLGRTLPALYRKLLMDVGAGGHGDVEIYHPMEINDLYQNHFENPHELFSTYFPFGCNNRSQEIWLIRIGDNLTASIWHETHPESYPEERWLECDQWLSENESTLPA